MRRRKLDLVSPYCQFRSIRSSAAALLVSLLAFTMFFFFGSASAAPLFPTPVELVPGGEQPRVAISAGGQVAAVWMHGFFTAPGCCSNFHDEVVAASGSALRGPWEAPEVISIPGYSMSQHSNIVSGPALTASPLQAHSTWTSGGLDQQPSAFLGRAI